MLFHTSCTLQPQTVRLLLASAAIFGFDIWTAKINQAYLQASEPLRGEIFIKHLVPEFELDPYQCLHLLHTLYGLCDAGDLCHTTLDNQHRNEMCIKPFRLDPSLYYLLTNKVLQGISRAYVDDPIRFGKMAFRNTAFREKSIFMNKRFEMADDETLPSGFTGFITDHSKDG